MSHVEWNAYIRIMIGDIATAATTTPAPTAPASKAKSRAAKANAAAAKSDVPKPKAPGRPKTITTIDDGAGGTTLVPKKAQTKKFTTTALPAVRVPGATFELLPIFGAVTWAICTTIR